MCGRLDGNFLLTPFLLCFRAHMIQILGLSVLLNGCFYLGLDNTKWLLLGNVDEGKIMTNI